MKVVVISGSPRKNGYTEKMVEKFISHVSGEVVYYNAYNEKVAPCTDCRFCFKKRECSIKDSMTNIYEDLEQSDVIVFATPVYFHSVSAPLKMIIDRLQVYWSNNYVRKEKSILKEKKIE